jgi:integrase
MHMRRQATGRATIHPVERRKRGKTFWQARGQVPIRKADGSIGSRRVERGFGPECKTARDREKKCAEWNIEYEERFRNPRKLITFAKAYSNYISKKKPMPYYADEILEYIGTMQCLDIDDSTMVELAEELWPDDASAGTMNRHLYTPVIAVLHMALKEQAPELERPDGHNKVLPVMIPPLSWYRQVEPELNPRQRAFMFFLAMHGRRTVEALARIPRDLDPDSGILDLGKTKTGLRQIELHPHCLNLILAIPNWNKQKWLFGCGPNSANSFRRDLKVAIERSGATWYHPHAFGRHNSVTRMLRAGHSTAHVADAHGMTAEMVTKRYGHLSKRETTAALHAVGGDLFEQVFNGGSVGDKPANGALQNGHNGLKLLPDLSAQSAPEMLPSEGSALSDCATGAQENPENPALLVSIIDRTRRQQSPRDGGNVGE